MRFWFDSRPDCCQPIIVIQVPNDKYILEIKRQLEDCRADHKSSITSPDDRSDHMRHINMSSDIYSLDYVYCLNSFFSQNVSGVESTPVYRLGFFFRQNDGFYIFHNRDSNLRTFLGIDLDYQSGMLTTRQISRRLTIKLCLPMEVDPTSQSSVGKQFIQWNQD